MKLSLIAALDRNGLIGAGNALPWHLPADLRHFKDVTMGKAVVMGRKTCEAIGRPLPGRTNIVLSREPDFSPEGFDVCRSAAGLVRLIEHSRETVVIGGAEIYRLFFDQVTRAYITLVDGEFEGDTWFPQWPLGHEWRVFSEVRREADEKNPHAMTFLIYERF